MDDKPRHSCLQRLFNWFRGARKEDNGVCPGGCLGTSESDTPIEPVEERLGRRPRIENTVLIKNVINRCSDGNTSHRLLSGITGIMLHRIGTSIGSNGEEITQSFKNTKYPNAGYWTGGKMAYTFVILPNGMIEQTKPLTIVTPHARKYNKTYIGIACIGDFTKEKPTSQQWRAAALLCAALPKKLGNESLPIVAHTKLPEASSDSSKECPGAFWPMPQFLDAIKLLADTTLNLDLINA